MFNAEIAKKLKKIVPLAGHWQVNFAPEGFGDYTTNLAMTEAKRSGRVPQEAGRELAARFKKNRWFKKNFSDIKAERGFVNFYLSDSAVKKGLNEIISRKERYGSSKKGRGEKINLEFVSANPTGPLTLGNGRSASYGSSLANLLDFLGYRVTKEYYLNDTGRQVEILGESVARRFLELNGRPTDYPQELYQGGYIADLAKEFKKEGVYHGSLDDLENLAKTAKAYAIEKLTASIRESLRRFGVNFDVWFSESGLEKSGELQNLFNYLEFSRFLYKKDGAVWFKATGFGLAQDVVLKKSNGAATYLASDLAYAQNKAKRGFRRMIYIFGADHHGDVDRIKAGLRALNLDESKFKILLYQLVTLKEKGETVRMSKRAGRFVTLDELLKEIPPDVARFFFLTKSLDSHIEFDLELAKEASARNPVYYLQYAYVRMASVLKKAAEGKIRAGKKTTAGYVWQKEETNLIRKLIKFPEVLDKIADDFQIHRLAAYLLETAALVNKFYENCRIIGEEKKKEKTRLVLARASAWVLRNGLRILGLSVPEKM